MPDRVAAEVFEVSLVDHPMGPLKRAARWGGTIAAGLLDSSTMAPVMADLVIRRDGRELRRIVASDVGDLGNLHDRILLELETSTPEAFAESWELPLA